MNNPNFLTLAEISEALKDRRLHVIAKRTGLSYPTLKRLSDGIDTNYNLDTLRTITAYLKDDSGDGS
tara:strand:+ start:563 stop:763 length:201 start_codon:yes stop_codon:yes gene_type:complete